MANVSSLSDMRKKEEEKKQNELFVGGLDQRGGGSGLNVLGPPPSGRGPPRPGGAGAPSSGAGGGVFDRIVQKASNTDDAGGDDSPAAAGAPNTGTKITLYRNGFTVNDGPLRDPESQENREFLSSLMRGEVPRELSAQALTNSNGPVPSMDISLADKREEDYSAPPAPAYIAFSGAANTLRSTEGSASAGSSDACVFTPDALASAPPAPAVDESQPTTTLQIRTHNGKKLRIKINQDATVLHLALRIHSEGAGDVAFVLSSGFPPADIRGDASMLTIKDAGLVGAAVTQKPYP